jgi:hypothetical protein
MFGTYIVTIGCAEILQLGVILVPQFATVEAIAVRIE